MEKNLSKKRVKNASPPKRYIWFEMSYLDFGHQQKFLTFCLSTKRARIEILMDDNEKKITTPSQAHAVSCGKGCTEDIPSPLSSASNQRVGGAPVKADRGLMCPVCMEKPKHPFAGKCGHVACHVCWQVPLMHSLVFHS